MGVHQGASWNSTIPKPLLQGGHEIPQPSFRNQRRKQRSPTRHHQKKSCEIIIVAGLRRHRGWLSSGVCSKNYEKYLHVEFFTYHHFKRTAENKSDKLCKASLPEVHPPYCETFQVAFLTQICDKTQTYVYSRYTKYVCVKHRSVFTQSMYFRQPPLNIICTSTRK